MCSKAFVRSSLLTWGHGVCVFLIDNLSVVICLWKKTDRLGELKCLTTWPSTEFQAAGFCVPNPHCANVLLRKLGFRICSYVIMERKGSRWPNMSSHTFVYIIKHTFYQKANRLILLVKTRNMWIKHYKIQRRCLFNLELSLNCTKCTYVPLCGLMWIHKWDRCLQSPLCSIYPARSTVSFFSENIQWPNFWGDFWADLLHLF